MSQVTTIRILLSDSLLLLGLSSLLTALYIGLYTAAIQSLPQPATPLYCDNSCPGTRERDCDFELPFLSPCGLSYSLGGYLFVAIGSIPCSYAGVAVVYRETFGSRPGTKKRERVTVGTVALILLSTALYGVEAFLLKTNTFAGQAVFALLNGWLFYDGDAIEFLLRLTANFLPTLSGILMLQVVFPLLLSSSSVSSSRAGSGRTVNGLISFGLPAVFFSLSFVTKQCIRLLLGREKRMEKEERERQGTATLSSSSSWSHSSPDATLFVMYILYQLLQLTASISRGRDSLTVVSLSILSSCTGYILTLAWNLSRLRKTGIFHSLHGRRFSANVVKVLVGRSSAEHSSSVSPAISSSLLRERGACKNEKKGGVFPAESAVSSHFPSVVPIEPTSTIQKGGGESQEGEKEEGNVGLPSVPHNCLSPAAVAALSVAHSSHITSSLLRKSEELPPPLMKERDLVSCPDNSAATEREVANQGKEETALSSSIAVSHSQERMEELPTIRKAVRQVVPSPLLSSSSIRPWPTKALSPDETKEAETAGERRQERTNLAATSPSSSPAEVSLQAHLEASAILWKRMALSLIVATVCGMAVTTSLIPFRNYFLARLIFSAACYRPNISLSEALNLEWQLFFIVLTGWTLMAVFICTLEAMQVGVVRTWLVERKKIMKTALLLQLLYSPFLSVSLLHSMLLDPSGDICLAIGMRQQTLGNEDYSS